jgi:RNA polymerase sigma factor (sigma-70 family)
VRMATTSAPVVEDQARTREEERLARRAADGDGAAFATLYDRYERRIFNYCLRLLNSPDDASDATQEAFLKVLQRLPKLGDRELNFSAYLYTAARNASYDMIGRRKRAEPVDEIPEPAGAGARELGAIDEDPERAALLDSFQADVQDANARLPERQREVLVMREVDELSYDEIAEIMDMNRNSVAQLISRARIKLRDELRGTALASIGAGSAECEKALPLIAMRQDSQLKKAEDREWLKAHLATCETCKVSVEAMEEAGVSYRAWLPIVPLEFLRRATIAKAAEHVGADWSEFADAGRPGGDPSSPAGHEAGEAADGDGAHPPGGHAAGGLLHLPASWLRRSGHAAGAEEDGSRRRKRALLLGVIAALLLLAGVTAVVSGSGDAPATDEPVGEEAAAASDDGAGGDAGDSTATGGGGSAGAASPGAPQGAGGKDKGGKDGGPLAAVPFLPGVKVEPDGTIVRTGAGTRTRRGGKPPAKRGGSNTTTSNGGGNGSGGGGAKKPAKKPTRTPSSNNGGNRTPSGGGNTTPPGGGGATDQPVAQPDPPAQSDPTPPAQSDPTPPAVSDPTPPGTGGGGSTNNGGGGSSQRPSGGGGSTTPSRTPSTNGGAGTTAPTTPPCRTPTGRPC